MGSVETIYEVEWQLAKQTQDTDRKWDMYLEREGRRNMEGEGKVNSFNWRLGITVYKKEPSSPHAHFSRRIVRLSSSQPPRKLSSMLDYCLLADLWISGSWDMGLAPFLRTGDLRMHDYCRLWRDWGTTTHHYPCLWASYGTSATSETLELKCSASTISTEHLDGRSVTSGCVPHRWRAHNELKWFLKWAEK